VGKGVNEDLSLVDEIASPDCRVFQARTDGKSSEDQQGIEALKSIIKDGSGFFEDIDMKVEVGPLVDKPYVSARWKFSGKYKGGMQGATIEKGTEVSFRGIDIFLIENGKIQKYWVSSDGIDLLGQLGMF